MGVYVYSVRRTSKSVRLPDGETVTAYLLKYHWKPWGDEKLDRPFVAQLARMEKAWERAGEWPEYVVVGDAFGDGEQVRTWDSKGGLSCYDEPDYGCSTHIGTLAKQGKEWVCVAGIRAVEDLLVKALPQVDAYAEYAPHDFGVFGASQDIATHAVNFRGPGHSLRALRRTAAVLALMHEQEDLEAELAEAIRKLEDQGVVDEPVSDCNVCEGRKIVVRSDGSCARHEACSACAKTTVLAEL